MPGADAFVAIKLRVQRLYRLGGVQFVEVREIYAGVAVRVGGAHTGVVAEGERAIPHTHTCDSGVYRGAGAAFATPLPGMVQLVIPPWTLALNTPPPP